MFLMYLWHLATDAFDDKRGKIEIWKEDGNYNRPYAKCWEERQH